MLSDGSEDGLYGIFVIARHEGERDLFTSVTSIRLHRVAVPGGSHAVHLLDSRGRDERKLGYPNKEVEIEEYLVGQEKDKRCSLCLPATWSEAGILTVVAPKPLPAAEGCLRIIGMVQALEDRQHRVLTVLRTDAANIDFAPFVLEQYDEGAGTRKVPARRQG